MSVAKKNSGFSLIELLTVLGLATLFLTMSVGVYFSFRQRNQIDIESQKVASALRLAQNKTLAAQNFETHGIHFDSAVETYTFFEGATFDSMDPDNEVVPLENNTEFSNIQLADGGVDVIFDRVSGRTTQYGFVEIVDVRDATIIRTLCIEGEGSVRILRVGSSSSICTQGVLEYTEGTTAADLASFPNNLGFGDAAQSFTVGTSDIYVHRVELFLMQTGTPSDVFLEMRSGTSNGTVVGKSLMVASSSLPTTLSWVRFIFPSPVTLTASSQYFLRLRSLPDSTVAFSGAAGTIYWGYEHSPSAPPAYSDGDAWRYVGANDNPLDQGQQLGPADQYDFSFRLFSQDGPSMTDSRHLEFDLTFSIRSNTNITLSFDGGSTVEVVLIADFMNVDSTIFDWEATIDVSGSPQSVRIHSLYIDDEDTILSIHRDRRLNDAFLLIDVDGTDVVTYTATGTPSMGPTIDSMVYR